MVLPLVKSTIPTVTSVGLSGSVLTATIICLFSNILICPGADAVSLIVNISVLPIPTFKSISSVLEAPLDIEYDLPDVLSAISNVAPDNAVKSLASDAFSAAISTLLNFSFILIGSLIVTARVHSVSPAFLTASTSITLI